jgi:hypothetical protein
LNAEKWSERKEQLDFLAKLVDTPKIATTGDFCPLVNALKKV